MLWSGLEAAAAGALSFAGAFILARLLGAAAFGIGAAAASVHVLLWVGVNAVLADAIVQRPALSRDEAGSAICAGLALGVAGAVVQIAAAWPLRAAFGDPRFAPMCLALALPLPLVGAAGPVQGLLTRARDYRRLALRTVLGQGVGLAVGLAVAGRGGGAWAIVAQQATASLAGALVLLCGGGWRARLAWRRRALADMLRIGLPLAGSTLILTARYRVFALLVGFVAGSAVLGQVHLAFRLVESVRELASTALWRLLLPLFAERQANRARMRRAVDRAVRMIATSLVPLCAVLALLVRPVVTLLLGPGWAPCATAALPLAVLAAWLFATFPPGVAAVALGAPQYALRAQAATALLVAAGVLLLRPASPVAASLVWVTAHALVAPYGLCSNAHVLRCSVWRTLTPGVPSLAATVLGGAAALLAAQAFGAVGLAGGLGAIALAALFATPPASRPAPLRSPARS